MRAARRRVLAVLLKFCMQSLRSKRPSESSGETAIARSTSRGRGSWTERKQQMERGADADIRAGHRRRDDRRPAAPVICSGRRRFARLELFPRKSFRCYECGDARGRLRGRQ